MNVQMSIAEIIKNAAGLEIKDFENLYKKLSVLRNQKQGLRMLDATESQLLNKINAAFPLEKWERLKYLDWKTEFSALDEPEEKESLELAENYENHSVKRLKYLTELATLRQVSVDTLIEQLGLNPQFNG